MLKRCFLCLMLLLSLGLPVHAMSVTALGNHIYLGHNDETATSGDVKFVIINHVLHLMSKDGTKDFLSFINTDGIVGSGVDYDVRDVYTSNPTMHLWEITASSGAHGKNCGYWLVGPRPDGSYLSYVSIGNFAMLGYTKDQWHRLSSELSNGLLVITSSHGYLPPGAQYGYETKYANDFQVQIFWDDKVNWFGLRRIY